MAQNKVTFGLSNVYYSVITYGLQNEPIYSAPKPMPGAVEMNLEVNSDQSEFFADNYLYYVSYGDNGYTGTLSLAEIPDSFATEVLGEETVGTHNLIKEVANPIKKNFALLFQVEGDKYNNKYCFFNCTASRPNISSSTQTATTEPVTKELSFSAMPRETDKAVKVRTTETTIKGVHDTWFVRVYDEIVNSVANADVTFSKQAPNDPAFAVVSTGGAVPTGMLLNGNNVVTNGGANWAITPTNTITVKRALLQPLLNGVHEITIITDKGNYITVELTVEA